VEESAFIRRGVASLALIADIPIGVIHTNDTNTNRIVPPFSKLQNLIPQVINHTVDLLDHSLGKNLHFDANLDGSYKSPGNAETFIQNWCFPCNDFPKGAISASGLDAMSSILDV
jgi:hypothetical protein